MRCSNGHPVVAAVLDLVMWPLRGMRSRVVPEASGRILEVGVGTGLNLGEYRPERVERLVGIEPDPYMLRRARPRFEAAAFPAELVEAGAEAMPFEDASFDAVVVTFTLCTIPEIEAAVREMHRVLAPGGTLHFAEHGLSEHRVTAGVQRAIDPIWSTFTGGCHLVRDPVALLREGGFDLVEVRGYGRGPLDLAPVQRGRAVKG